MLHGTSLSALRPPALCHHMALYGRPDRTASCHGIQPLRSTYCRGIRPHTAYCRDKRPPASTASRHNILQLRPTVHDIPPNTPLLRHEIQPVRRTAMSHLLLCRSALLPSYDSSDLQPSATTKTYCLLRRHTTRVSSHPNERASDHITHARPPCVHRSQPFGREEAS